jgi:hypothetical protein
LLLQIGTLAIVILPDLNTLWTLANELADVVSGSADSHSIDISLRFATKAFLVQHAVKFVTVSVAK